MSFDSWIFGSDWIISNYSRNGTVLLICITLRTNNIDGREDCPASQINPGMLFVKGSNVKNCHKYWEGNCHQLIYSDKYININYTIISTQIMYDFLFPLFFTGPTIPMLGQYFTVSFQSLVFLLKLHLPHLNYKICLLSE